jgi:hypothetical protein
MPIGKYDRKHPRYSEGDYRLRSRARRRAQANGTTIEEEMKTIHDPVRTKMPEEEERRHNWRLSLIYTLDRESMPKIESPYKRRTDEYGNTIEVIEDTWIDEDGNEVKGVK